MASPKTLLQLSGADLTPPRLADAAVVLIDMQNEYLDGPIAVSGAAEAVAEAGRLLERARAAGAPVIHIAHKGRAGSLFDRDAPRGRIIDALAPQGDEPVIEKHLPNSFAGTTLGDALKAAGKTDLVVAGFMTHMCVSSTARVAMDTGYRVTVLASASATRDLPDGRGGVVAAATLHDVALVELSDRFAIIAPDVSALG